LQRNFNVVPAVAIAFTMGTCCALPGSAPAFDMSYVLFPEKNRYLFDGELRVSDEVFVKKCLFGNAG
jgi:hypothetical protein